MKRYDRSITENTAIVRRFPIEDMGIPTEPLMERILDEIDKGLEDGRQIYVHGSIGRAMLEA